MPQCCSKFQCAMPLAALPSIGGHRCLRCKGQVHGCLCATDVPNEGDERGVGGPPRHICFMCIPKGTIPSCEGPPVKEPSEDEEDDSDDDIVTGNSKTAQLIRKQDAAAKERKRQAAEEVRRPVGLGEDSDGEDLYLAEKEDDSSTSVSSQRKKSSTLKKQRTSVASTITHQSIEEVEVEQDEFEDDADEADNTSVCQRFYIENKNDKKVLFAMAVGIGKDGDVEDIGDLEVEPYSSSKKKSHFKPSSPVLHKEVQRRSGIAGGAVPKSKNWKNPKLLEWLKENPITDADDLKFVKAEVAAYRQLLLAAAAETKKQDDDANARWTGSKPYLRLYHVLIDDTLRDAYFHRNDVMNRAQLDARKSTDRPPTFYEEAAALYNNQNFNPTTSSFPDLHSDFAEPISLPASEAPIPVNAEKIKLQLADARAKLTMVRFHGVRFSKTSPLFCSHKCLVQSLLYRSLLTGNRAEMEVVIVCLDRTMLGTLMTSSTEMTTDPVFCSTTSHIFCTFGN